MPILSKILNQSAGTHAQFLAEELLLLKFFDQLPFPMAILLGSEHTFAYANVAYRKFVNRDLLGKKIREVFDDVDSGPYLTMLDQVFVSGKPHIGNESPVTLHASDGRTTDYFINFGYHPFRDQAGKIQGVIIQIQDVTDQVLPRQMLQETQRILELALRSAKMESWRIDVKTRTVIGSRIMGKGATQRSTEGPFEEIIRKVIYPEDQEQVIDAISESIRTRNPYQQQFRVITPNGEVRWIDAQGDFDYDPEGNPITLAGVSTDVTERVFARRALENSVENLKKERDLREQFVTTLSHDLRSPMTAAKMSAQLIEQRTKEDPAVQKLIGRVVQNLNRADGMIRDLLDANRIKAGEGLPIQVQECDLSQTLTNTLRELNQLHGQRFRIDDLSPGQVCHLDSSGVVRIVENLAGNAVKYGAPEKPITVRLRIEDADVTLSVHNEGNPISKENQEILFEHYQRTSCALASGHKGWGIGLALVRGIAESHRGRAWVESCPDLGTTFYVRMPRDARGAVTPKLFSDQTFQNEESR